MGSNFAMPIFPFHLNLSKLLKEKICSLRTNLSLRVDLFWKGYIDQASKQEATKVVSLYKMVKSHGCVGIHFKINALSQVRHCTG